MYYATADKTRITSARSATQAASILGTTDIIKVTDDELARTDTGNLRVGQVHEPSPREKPPKRAPLTRAPLYW